MRPGQSVSVLGARRLRRRPLGLASVGALLGLALGCAYRPRAFLAPVVAEPVSEDRAVISLPAFPRPADSSAEDVIARRRSVREYADTPVSLDQLTRLLHYADGVTDPNEGFRAAPSAGALYPIDIYVCASSVNDLRPGVYRYLPDRHALEQRYDGDVRQQLFRAALSQPQVHDAALVLVLTGLPERLDWRYGNRSERYMLLEAGHIAQNLYLEATVLGLGCCALGAFQDEAVNQVLGISGETERALYLVTLGPPAG